MLIYRLCIAITGPTGERMNIGRGVDSPGQAQGIAEAGWAQDAVDGSQTRYTLMTWRPADTMSVLVGSQELKPPVPVG